MNKRNLEFKFFVWIIVIGIILVANWALIWFPSRKTQITNERLMSENVENSQIVQEIKPDDERTEPLILPSAQKLASYWAYSQLDSPNFLLNRDGLIVDVTEQGRSEQTLEIPFGVLEIGSYAFNNCQNLKRVVIPKSVHTIRDYAFKDCKQLEGIEISANIENIGKNVFSGCSKLKPESVINSSCVLFDWWVANHKYEDKTLSEMVEINLADYKNSDGASFKRIGKNAFSSCLNLHKITIPDSIEVIDQDAFSQCKLLKSDTVVNNSRVVFDWWVRNHKYDSVTMYDYIYYHNYLDLSSFKNSNGQSFNSIGGRAFDLCSCLWSISLPKDLKIIGDGAFSRADSLPSIDLPSGLTKIGVEAFSGCSSINSLVIPSSVETIGYRAFAECHSLKNVVFGYGISFVAPGMFFNCRSLKAIELPRDLIKIGDSAFSNCSELETITVPSGIHEIGSSVWNKCQQLKEVILPSGLQKVGDRLFANCPRLKKITIPKSVTSLGNELFMHNQDLEDIFINGNNLTYGKNLIKYINNQQVVYHVVDENLYKDLMAWGVNKERIKRVRAESQL